MPYLNEIEISTYWILISILVFFAVGFIVFKLLYLKMNARISSTLALVIATLFTCILFQSIVIYQLDVIKKTNPLKTEGIKMAADLSIPSKADQNIKVRDCYNMLIKINRAINNSEGEALELYFFGVYESKHENYEKAQALFDHSLEVGGHYRYLYNRILEAKGFAYIEQNRLMEASKIFDTLLLKTIEDNSLHELIKAEVYFNLGHVNKLNHQIAKARDNFIKSLRVIEKFIIKKQGKIDNQTNVRKTDYTAAYNNSYIALVSLETEAGNFDEALRVYNKFKNVVDPAINFELLIDMNETEHRLNKKMQTHKIINEFDKLHSEIDYAYALNKYYLTIGDDEFAYGHIDEARKAYFKSYEIWGNYFNEMVQKYNSEEAISNEESRYFALMKKYGLDLVISLNKLIEFEDEYGDAEKSKQYKLEKKKVLSLINIEE